MIMMVSRKRKKIFFSLPFLFLFTFFFFVFDVEIEYFKIFLFCCMYVVVYRALNTMTRNIQDLIERYLTHPLFCTTNKSK